MWNFIVKEKSFPRKTRTGSGTTQISGLALLSLSLFLSLSFSLSRLLLLGALLLCPGRGEDEMAGPMKYFFFIELKKKKNKKGRINIFLTVPMISFFFIHARNLAAPDVPSSRCCSICGCAHGRWLDSERDHSPTCSAAWGQGPCCWKTKTIPFQLCRPITPFLFTLLPILFISQYLSIQVAKTLSGNVTHVV